MRLHLVTSLMLAVSTIACGPDDLSKLLSIESVSDGGRIQDSASTSGTDSATISLKPGYQKILIHVNRSVGIVAAGEDSQGALPTGALAFADSNGSYIPLLETEPGTVAAEVPAGYYWITTTERDPITITMGAKDNGMTTYSATADGIGTMQQSLSTGGGRWAKFIGKVLINKVLGRAVRTGCRAAIEVIQIAEGIKCQNLPVDYVGDNACFKALFGCAPSVY